MHCPATATEWPLEPIQQCIYIVLIHTRKEPTEYHIRHKGGIDREEITLPVCEKPIDEVTPVDKQCDTVPPSTIQATVVPPVGEPRANSRDSQVPHHQWASSLAA